MPLAIHYSNVARIFTNTAAQYSSTPHQSPLIRSGLVNSLNTIREKGTGETFHVPRTGTAYPIEKDISDYTHASFSEVKAKVAANKFKMIVSSQDQATMARGFFNPDIVRGIIKAEGSTQYIHRVIGVMNEHYAAVCRGMDKSLFNSILANHYVKADGDGLSFDGTDTTFDADTGRASYSSTVDLTAPDANTQYALTADLNKALKGGAGANISLLEAGAPLYVLTPHSIFNAFSATYSFPRMWDSTGRSGAGDGTPTHSMNGILTANGYTFVALDDTFFTKETVNTKQAWPLLILPASAMSFCVPNINIANSITYGGRPISDEDVVNAIYLDNSGGGVDNGSDRFTALMNSRTQIDGDPLILQYNGAPATGVYYSAVFDFHDLDPSATSESKGTSFDASAMVAGVRAKPHFIQKYHVAADFMPVAVSAAGAGKAAK